LQIEVHLQQTGVNFIKILREAFTHTDSKSIKFQLSCQYLFMLLGSAFVKALQKMLMKLTPGQQFQCHCSEHDELPGIAYKKRIPHLATN